MKVFKYIVTVGTVLALTGCVAHQVEPPPLNGPSGFALSLSVTASPEAINQDGGSQSRITVTAIGAEGKPRTSLPVRVDMQVGGVARDDWGTLSARTLVTDSSGRATTTFTAPPSPVGGIVNSCNGLPGNCVSIVAIASDAQVGNFDALNSASTTIRLVPPGVILPPAYTPKAAFTFLPSSGILVGNTVTFDASASCATDSTGTCSSTAGTIVSYAWNFADGSAGTGVTTTHAFSSFGTFVVTLTVTSDRGV